MLTTLSPLFHRVATQVRPEDLLLQKGSWVHFSRAWPSTWSWASGKSFGVSEEPLLVRYARSYVLPESDYQDYDLSNATAGLKLYPEEQGMLYQCALGLKPGNYIVHLFVPTNRYIYALGEATMYPDVANANLRYLGALRPEDSPHDSPLTFLYFIKDAPAFILRLYVLAGTSYEKVTLEFSINKCKLREVALTEEQAAKALRIAYYTEFQDTPV